MPETAPTAEQERHSNGFSSSFFLICLLVSGICFFYGITGTQQYQQATKPIQEVKLGDRVVGTNPQLSDGQRNIPDPDSATWRKVTLRMSKGSGDQLDIKLLCPPEWTELHSAAAGDIVELDLEELGAVGTAEVLGVGPSPPIRAGPGSVVTGIYIHSSAEAMDLHLEGGETLGVTPSHPMWSDDRQDFVPAGTLEPGEHLLGLDGRRVAITDITPRAGPEPVYNLQVHGENVYQVGSDGLLAHNKAARVPREPVFDPSVNRWREPDTGRFVKQPRPDLGTPGTRRNPDGTLQDPADQLDQLRVARDRGGLIENMDRSEQNLDNFLDDLEGLSAEEIRRLLE